MGQKEFAEAWAAMLPDLVSITVRRLAYLFVTPTCAGLGATLWVSAFGIRWVPSVF
jgi:hypothetical protein